MRFLTFDVETGGVDIENDRIITCFLRATDHGEIISEKSWIVDPGVEIPKEASEVHGMTTEWVREHGRKDVATVIKEIRDEIAWLGGQGFIVCGYNHSFDLGILEHECVRHKVSPLDRGDYVYFDPLIVDRVVDKYRKGSRKLMDVAKVYGVPIDESKLHDASYDVFVTEQLIPKVLRKAWFMFKGDGFTGSKAYEFIEWLQPKQKEWKSEWAVGITEYFAKVGKKEEDGSPITVSGSFPW